MLARQWVFQTLVNDSGVGEIVDDRILANQSGMTAQIGRPFLVLKFGNDSDEQQFDDPDIPQRPHRQFLEVWCHDSRPSYTQIDELVAAVREALRVDQIAPDAHIMAVKYLETSADMDDQTMDTVLRYIRFQLVMSE
jgi:hypothetical protein